MDLYWYSPTMIPFTGMITLQSDRTVRVRSSQICMTTNHVLMNQENPGKPSIPELLAPAGSWESLVSAIAAGADAVYLGGELFGARQFAPNFDRTLLHQAVRYAHLHDVRVYVTVNTLVFEDELLNVAEYLVFLYETGVDAVLVQDTGLLLLAQRLVPDLCIHASTQMTIHSVAGARWAERKGCSRIVLPRELTRDEVREIADSCVGLDVGLEIFIHGALCYGWSGQCLLSSVIGGRSGNRGMCAQPCRKPYQLVAGTADQYGKCSNMRPVQTHGNYILSTRDLCCYPVLDSICAMPVISLKIEGRMRSPRYVANVVSVYKKAIDACARGTFHPEKEDLEILSLAYSRGFTTGYLCGNDPSAVMGRDKPGDRGLFVGTVEKYNGRKGTYVRSTGEYTLKAGDGLVCIHGTSEHGLVLKSDPDYVHGQFILPMENECSIGDPVYLTSRKAYSADADRYLQNPEIKKKQIPLDVSVHISDTGQIKVQGTILSRISPSCPFSMDPESTLVKAEKKPVTKEIIREQLTKTGTAPFCIRSLSLRYNGGLFAPISLLNQVRRDIIKTAENALISSRVPDQQHLKKAHLYLHGFQVTGSDRSSPQSVNRPGETSIIVITDRFDSCRAALEAGSDMVSFEFSHLSDQDSKLSLFAECVTLAHRSGRALQVKLPRIMREHQVQKLVNQLPYLIQIGTDGIMVDGHGVADILAVHAPDMELTGFIGLNICNHFAVESGMEHLSMITVSPELNLDQILSLALEVTKQEFPCTLGILVQGNIEALISEDLLTSCIKDNDLLSTMDDDVVLLGICDEKKRTFTVRVDPYNRTRIFNAVETTLIDFLPHLYKAGISSYIIDARGRPPSYVSDMVHIYQEACHCISDEIQFKNRLGNFKKEMKKRVRGGMTAAAFTRV